MQALADNTTFSQKLVDIGALMEKRGEERRAAKEKAPCAD